MGKFTIEVRRIPETSTNTNLARFRFNASGDGSELECNEMANRLKYNSTEKAMYNFEIYDIVRQCGYPDCLFVVAGVIHDDERLFVVDDSGKYGNGEEFEIAFAEVSDHYRKL